jgi:hypothetical protein
MTSQRPLKHAVLLALKIAFALGGLASIGLVGLVGLLALALFGHVGREDARGGRGRLDLGSIGNTLVRYHARAGRRPASFEGLLPLADREVTDGVPRDPWGTPYSYTLKDDTVEVRSLGADSALGGTGNDADIVVRIPRTQGHRGESRVTP